MPGAQPAAAAGSAGYEALPEHPPAAAAVQPQPPPQPPHTLPQPLNWRQSSLRPVLVQPARAPSWPPPPASAARPQQQLQQLQQAYHTAVPVSLQHEAAVAERLLWHACHEAEESLDLLRSSAGGLEEREAARRLRVHGPNAIAAQGATPWYSVLWHALWHPFNVILLLLAATSFLTSDPATSAIMLLMVTVSTALRFWQDMKSTVAAARLAQMVQTRATVVRQDPHTGLSVERAIDQRDVVPGDIVRLFAGQMMPGDVRLLRAKDLFAGEAALTGEAMPVEKRPQAMPGGSGSGGSGAAPPALLECRSLGFMGTHVVSGTGLGLVVATGGQTFISTVADQLGQQKLPNAFQLGVRRVSYLLILFMAAMVPLVVAFQGFITGDWAQAALFGISVAVGLTPEMLPAIVNMNLAKGAVAMARQSTIVKRLDAVQNLGAMDILATDKTGTLTLDEVVLTRWLDWRGAECPQALRFAFLNAHFHTGSRNLLDAAILDSGKAKGLEGEVGRFERVDELPFDFVRRRLSVVLQGEGEPPLLVCKGAVEEIVALCCAVEQGGGVQGQGQEEEEEAGQQQQKVEALDERWRAELLALGERLNADGLLVLAVAVKELPTVGAALSAAAAAAGVKRQPVAPAGAPIDSQGGSGPGSSAAALSAASKARLKQPVAPAGASLHGQGSSSPGASSSASWDASPAGASRGSAAAAVPAAVEEGKAVAGGASNPAAPTTPAAANERGLSSSSGAAAAGAEPTLAGGSAAHGSSGAASLAGASLAGANLASASLVDASYGVEDEVGLTFVGFLAFLDPPKQSALEAVRELQAKRVHIKILTGDSAEVARKVCREVGVTAEHYVTGPELDKLGPADFIEAARRASVLAKLTPAQKARVVAALKGAGHTVGFLGDGVNDALALRTADVGISVDTGSDIAKDAADVILLEKSLMVLEHGVVQGRVTHGNTVKYIKMAASSNFGNVFSVLIASACLPFQPMRPIQLLTQNLLYDLSQTAIPFDTMDASYVKAPRTWSASGIALFMLCIGPISSVFDVTTFALLWFWYGANSPARQALFQTGWFTVGITTQTLIVHLIRTERIPFLQEIAAWPVIIASLVISAAGLALPFTPVGAVERMEHLPPSLYAWVAATLAGYALLLQLAKTVYIRRFRSWL